VAGEIRLQGITKRYLLAEGEIRALDGLSLFFPKGSFTVVLGRSGSGKTTLLRLLAGLEEPTEGRILFSEDVRRRGRRGDGVGIVFQEPRLMPWLTVEDNVAFALKGRLEDEEIAARTMSILALLGMETFRSAYPDQLSGGMAQRVALGRTLAFDPEVVLMDEPLGALDYFTRRRLQGEIAGLHRETGKTFLLVTHDVEEALALGDRVVVLEAGRVTDCFCIPFDRPRETGCPEFLPLRRRVLESIAGEQRLTGGR